MLIYLSQHTFFQVSSESMHGSPPTHASPPHPKIVAVGARCLHLKKTASRSDAWEGSMLAFAGGTGLALLKGSSWRLSEEWLVWETSAGRAVER